MKVLTFVDSRLVFVRKASYWRRKLDEVDIFWCEESLNLLDWDVEQNPNVFYSHAVPVLIG